MRAVVALAGLLLAAGSVRGTEVVNSAFSDIGDGTPVGWRCGSHFRAVRGVGHNGSPGVVYENGDPSCAQEALAQDLRPEVGVAYRFSCLVRTEGFRANGRNGIGIGLEWVDAAGKWLGGGYNQHPFVEPNAEWVTLEGSTSETPKEVASLRLVVFVRGGCTGRAFFDNVVVEPLAREPVAFVLSDAYRGEVTGGTLRLCAALNPPRGASGRDLKAVFSFVDGKGANATRQGTLTEDLRAATLELPVAELASGRHPVACALVGSGGRELGRAATDVVRTAWPSPRRVRIDGHRRCLVDGKPFFPLGMYWGKVEADRLETYAKGPFNCLLTYSSVGQGEMDLCQEKGVKVIPCYNSAIVNSDWARRRKLATRGQLDDFLRGEIVRLKDHPALLAWYIGDECPVCEIPERTHVYRLFRELDPDHPTYLVLDRTRDLRAFLPTCDVIGVDPYPVCNPFSGKERIGRVAEMAAAAATAAFDSRPLWNVPQAFDWGNYRSKYASFPVEARAPTEDEIRNMCWQHVAVGANGLILYSYFDCFVRPERFDALWNGICKVGREIRSFAPVLLSVDPAPRAAGAPAGMRVRTWVHRGQLYLLAVNATESPTAARLRLSSGGWRELRRGIGAAGELIGSDQVALELPPLGVSLVRLSAF